MKPPGKDRAVFVCRSVKPGDGAVVIAAASSTTTADAQGWNALNTSLTAFSRPG
jgi:hypothetical protein